jgi:hypothetical protein
MISVVFVGSIAIVKLPIAQRMRNSLKRKTGGAMTPKDLADELGEKLNSVTRIARRERTFVVLPGGKGQPGRIGLRDFDHDADRANDDVF